MPLSTLYIINKQLEKVLEDSEFKDSLVKTNLTKTKILNIAEQKESEIISSVTSALAEYDNVETSLQQIKSKNRRLINRSEAFRNVKYDWNFWFISTTLLIFIVLAFIPFFVSSSATWWLGWVYERPATSNYRYFEAIFIGLLFALVLLTPLQKLRIYILKFCYKLYFSRTQSPLLTSYYADSQKLKDLEQIITQNIREKGLKELIRSLLNEQIKLSYRTSFEISSSKGLGEVMNLEHAVTTASKTKLQFLLDTMPGGAIGIAGSRGAGKSTLIQNYCGSEKTDSKVNGKSSFAVMISAPVKYDPRDFLLHLFKVVCTTVVKKELGPQEFDFEKFTNEVSVREAQSDQRWLLSKILSLLPAISIMLLIFGLIGGSGPIKITEEKQLKDTSHILKATLPKILSDTAKQGLKKNDSLAEQNALMFAHIGKVFKKALPREDISIQFFRWSAGLFTIWLVYHFVLGASMPIFLTSRRERRVLIERNQREKYENYLREKLSANPDLNYAISWLSRIRFQQSFTTGWSGTLKLPIALEANMNKVMTFAERQLSYPEIITGFREFLDRLQLRSPVIVGIDELDKLSSDEMAQEFLNEIKSVFGIPNCFFLISVSANAMTNFERRGMPFRDVFDSSFDSIIYVEHFQFQDAVALLQRRVIGNPIPFFSLAFCLSGGLPRDLIRYFRDIVRVATDEKSLSKITNILVYEDISAKIRALIHTLGAMENLSESNLLLKELDHLATGLARAKILASVSRIKTILSTISTAITEILKLPKNRKGYRSLSKAKSFNQPRSGSISLFSFHGDDN